MPFGLILLFALLLPAADDPTDHVGAVRLGSVQQRHDRLLLVRNTIQGTGRYITRYITKYTILSSLCKSVSYFRVILEHKI